MKKALKFIGWTFGILVALILILVIGVSIFMYTAPQIGNPPEGEDLVRIEKSPLFRDGIFENVQQTKVGSPSAIFSTLPDLLFGEDLAPEFQLPVAFDDASPAPDTLHATVTWYGHSAFLVEIDDMRILLDPMLGPVSAPVSFGTSRFEYESPIPMDEITNIDAVLLSHDHYDHLDYFSIMKLDEEIGHYYVPLGLGSHLKHWGISESKITELDWWESAELKSLEFTSCPARHFSGRGFSDRNATLWTSWALQGEYQNLYFSGDGGYGPHFKEIGDKLGPFDLAMLECGQYNEAWSQIHMMPEESVQAGLDVKAETLMPIHWGAFQLAVHSWTDPIDRFTAESKRLGAQSIHPVIGEKFQIGKDQPQFAWWQTEQSKNK